MSSHADTDTVAVEIPADQQSLSADLTVPADASGVVVFAHGSGSSRHSKRNRFVSEQLNNRGLATLLLDLLIEAEEQVDRVTREHRFDIPLLAVRLEHAIDWCASNDTTSGLPIGLFGASTGAAAALIAAAKKPDIVEAVVSRGGRPDMAAESLLNVKAPTLLIVGGRDEVVIGMNRQAYTELTCEKDLSIVPGATHLFEEAGALESVAEQAGDWFGKHLGSS